MSGKKVKKTNISQGDEKSPREPELFPGKGGYFRFTHSGAVLFIPRDVLAAWKCVEVDADEEEGVIIIRKAEPREA